MFHAISVVLAFSTASSALGASNFDYDPESPAGPPYWDKIDTGATPNECTGEKNSPVAIEDRECDKKKDYTMDVSFSALLSSPHSLRGVEP